MAIIKNKAGESVARKLINAIVDKSIDLQKNPYKRQEEELLVKFEQEFRCLLFKKYKIIYFINLENKRIDVIMYLIVGRILVK